MDAARDLTGSEQAGDLVALDGQGLGVTVNVDAAHAVVDAGVDGDGVEGSGLKLGDEARGAAEGVLGAVDGLVVGVDGSLELVGRDAERVGQASQVIGLDAHFLVLVLGAGLVVVVHGLVVHNPNLAVRLGHLGGGHDVASAHLVGEAVAGVVDQDAATAADALGDERAVGEHGGVNLNLAHLDEVGASVLGHDHAVARDGGGVGGNEGLQVGTVHLDHVLVGAEAAGGQNDSLGVVLRAVLAHDARHSAGLVDDELGGTAVVNDLDAGVAHGLGEGGNVGGAHSGAVGGTVAALHAHAAGGGDVVENQAMLGEPVDGGSGALAHLGHELDVVPVVATGDGLRDEQVGGVLDALLLLIGGLRGVHAGGSKDGVTALHGVLLEDDDLLDAGLAGGQSGAHAGAAHANDDDVVVATGRGLLSKGSSGRHECGCSGSGQEAATIHRDLSHDTYTSMFSGRTPTRRLAPE